MDENRIEQLERRLDELEGRRNTVQRSRAAMNSVVPDETREHLRAAGREQLLAVRSLLDYWIVRLRDQPDRPDKTESARENIPID
ncbi:MAG TPA: hypothetical protein VK992_04420 [Candidatus Caenarcaniphilales bacterium]|nr:hypothetical protein [Candidatus Caenarcaniphilales bacterium]